VTDFGICRFIVLYHTPEFNINAVSQDYTKRSCDFLRCLCGNEKSVIIVGDVKLPHVNWSAVTAAEYSFRVL